MTSLRSRILAIYEASIKSIFGGGGRQNPVNCNYGYSQEGEDVVLSALVKRHFPDLNSGGIYVDVGAHDPVRFSNTALFYLEGWRGLNIDPNAEAEARFREVRPDDRFLRIGVSDSNRTASFYRYNESALNGIDNDRSEELHGTSYSLESIEEIGVRSLCSILEECFPGGLPSPNFLNVDVEGHEMSVLRGNDWEKYVFDFLLVEDRVPLISEIHKGQCFRFLSDRGYRLHAFTGRTCVYSRFEKS